MGAMSLAPLTRLDPWLPPVVLMAVIFALSAQPELSSGLGTLDLILRKIAHAAEYALLCFLWWRALARTRARRWAPVLAFAIAIAYSATDEYHQTFVEGRHGTPVDVLIDAAGAGAATLAIRRRASAPREPAGATAR
jgi:VanZ family protein